MRNNLEGSRSKPVAAASVQSQEEKRKMTGKENEESRRGRKIGGKEGRKEGAYKTVRVREIVYVRGSGSLSYHIASMGSHKD